MLHLQCSAVPLRPHRKHNLTLRDDALGTVVREYTRESGVRQLSREIERVARKLARNVASDEAVPSEVTGDDVKRLHGRPRVRPERAAESDVVGMATGMYYTPWAATSCSWKHRFARYGDARATASAPRAPLRVILTGQLGDVMKESARAALTYATQRRRAWESLLASSALEAHVHVPAGAIPKDGLRRESPSPRPGFRHSRESRCVATSR